MKNWMRKNEISVYAIGIATANLSAFVTLRGKILAGLLLLTMALIILIIYAGLGKESK